MSEGLESIIESGKYHNTPVSECKHRWYDKVLLGDTNYEYSPISKPSNSFNIKHYVYLCRQCGLPKGFKGE